MIRLEQRHSQRTKYKIGSRPLVRIGAQEFEIIDMSATGMRFILKPGMTFEEQTPISASIQSGGEISPRIAMVLRTVGDLCAVQFI